MAHTSVRYALLFSREFSMSESVAPRRRWVFMSPRDIGLFVRSARTDKQIARLRTTSGARAAFEAAYAGNGDPWASADPRYFYQRFKYEGLMAMLPPGRRFARALDIGSGVGAMSVALTGVADEVLGLDIAQSAVDRAAKLTAARPGLNFRQGDVTALDPALDGGFDLVVVADTLYYLDAVDAQSLARVVARIAGLLAPGGMCLVANHYFFAGDRDSRLSRRIHDVFGRSAALEVVRAQRRPFYLATLLTTAARPADLPPAA
jgi:SAM-dependent methyltransferase